MSGGLTINTNIASSQAINALSFNSKNLQKSLRRLATGLRINSSTDNPGTLAISMKMLASLQRNKAVSLNIGNAVSFLQTQEGALDTAADILDRISELKTLYDDETKTDADKDGYDTEFSELQSQLGNILGETFNSVSVFSDSGSTFSVTTSDDGTQTVTVTKSDLDTPIATIKDADGLSNIDVDDTTTAIDNVAGLLALNGAVTNRLDFADTMLTTSRINIESANSKIMDTDIATESANFAKFSILTQTANIMLAQTNLLNHFALKLLP